MEIGIHALLAGSPKLVLFLVPDFGYLVGALLIVFQGYIFVDIGAGGRQFRGSSE
jgi:hypothetical protein